MSSISLSRIIITFPEYANNQKYVYGWVNDNLIVMELLSKSERIPTCKHTHDQFHATFKTNIVIVVAIINIINCGLIDYVENDVLIEDEDDEECEYTGGDFVTCTYVSGSTLDNDGNRAIIEYCRSFETAFMNCLEHVLHTNFDHNYTGSFTYRWCGGNLLKVCGYVDGQLNGSSVEWDEDGVMISEAQYEKGVKIKELELFV